MSDEDDLNEILSQLFQRCLRRPETFLQKGFWTSKNFSLMVFFFFLRVSSRLIKMENEFR